MNKYDSKERKTITFKKDNIKVKKSMVEVKLFLTLIKGDFTL